jgi:hypothetical protein
LRAHAPVLRARESCLGISVFASAWSRCVWAQRLRSSRDRGSSIERDLDHAPLQLIIYARIQLQPPVRVCPGIQ